MLGSDDFKYVNAPSHVRDGKASVPLSHLEGPVAEDVKTASASFTGKPYPGIRRGLDRPRTGSPPLLARSTTVPRSPRIEESADEQCLLEPTYRILCISTYPYTADKNDELSFVEGQVIRVVRQVDGGWWEGQLGQQVGWFPANHVEEYVVPPEDAAEDLFDRFANTSVELDDLRLRTIMRNNEIRGSTIPMESELVSTGSDQGTERMRLLGHILLTEKQYIESLQRFMDEFVYPLYQVDWFPPQDHHAIFSNIEDILDFEKDFFSTLDRNIADDRMVGHCFLSMADRFKDVYAEYCTNLSHAVTVSTQYVHHVPMTRFLQSTSANSSPPILHMVSTLHKPAQWQNRYQAALRELLKATDECHPDHENLKAACHKLDSIVKHIERLKRWNENHEMVRGLVTQIIGWEGPRLELYGDLILEGNLKLLEGVRKRERRFYLLARVLIIVKPEQHSKTADIKLRLIEKLPLTSTVLISVPDSHEDGSNLAFQLSYQSDDSKVKTLSITAFNSEQKDKWIASITRQLEQNVGAAPVQGEDVDQIQVGESKFDGKSGRNLKWFASWSGRIRKKRPSLPNLKDYMSHAREAEDLIAGNFPSTHAQKDNVNVDLSAAKNANEEPSSRTKDKLCSHGAEPQSTTPFTSPADAKPTASKKEQISEPQDMSPPKSLLSSSLEESFGRTRRRRIYSGSTTRISSTVIGTTLEVVEHSRSCSSLSALNSRKSGDNVGKASKQHFENTARMHEATQSSRPQSSLTTITRSLSSSPASFLWMHSPKTLVGDDSASSAPSIPEVSTLVHQCVADQDGRHAKSNVLQHLAAPVAKTLQSLPVKSLEHQATIQTHVDLEELQSAELQSRSSSWKGEASSHIGHLGKSVNTTALLNSTQLPSRSDKALHSTNRQLDRENASISNATIVNVSHENRSPSQPYIEQPHGDAKVTSQQLQVGPSSSAIDAVGAGHQPIYLASNSRPSEFFIYPNVSKGNNPSVPDLPSTFSYATSSKRLPYHLNSSMSMADLGAFNKAPQRKSSVANLVSALRGSVKSLFRRSQSTNTLQTPRAMEETDFRRIEMTREHRKSSLMDVKDLLFKSKRKGQSAAPAAESTQATSIRKFSTNTASSSKLSLDEVPTPVVLQQPSHILSPPQSTRTSAEKARTSDSYSRFSSNQAVPLPSPLPSAPTATARACTPPRSREPVAPTKADEDVSDPMLRIAPDSGIYGLVTGGATKMKADIPKNFPFHLDVRISNEMQPKCPGCCGPDHPGSANEQNPGSPSSVINTGPAGDETLLQSRRSLSILSVKHDASTHGSAAQGRLRSSSLTAGVSSSWPIDAEVCNPRPTSHPHRVLRRARSNIARSTKAPARLQMTLAAHTRNTRHEDASSTCSSAPAPSKVETQSETPSETSSKDGQTEEFGPVIGHLTHLERTWYVDLAQKCEAMSHEIRELKCHLKAMEDQVK
ncbi:hypothetical protein PhCBS80983_g00242 [Powellomyces hirtus]|uniref:DH domain-containing protein n=1 Tax=Powellomyces hirtus TaxID=109895 RepID=A0A507EFT3_9FUNG|nr:hypothetical protein PhCBS80983_g00242 [Powellomyces hirtus]